MPRILIFSVRSLVNLAPAAVWELLTYGIAPQFFDFEPSGLGHYDP